MLQRFWRHTAPASLGALQRALTYYPDHTRPTPAEAGVPELAPVVLETEDGLLLLAWHAPPRAEGAPSLVYFHGNAGHIGMRGFKVRAYLNAGLGVLLTTWRGYSGNPGTPTEEGLYADGRAARAFLRSALGTRDERQILYGESRGHGHRRRGPPRPRVHGGARGAGAGRERPTAPSRTSPRAASRCCPCAR